MLRIQRASPRSDMGNVFDSSLLKDVRMSIDSVKINMLST
jgi:hypothetical protein